MSGFYSPVKRDDVSFPLIIRISLLKTLCFLIASRRSCLDPGYFCFVVVSPRFFLFRQVVKDIGLDATDEKLKEYVWNLLKSGQVMTSF